MKNNDIATEFEAKFYPVDKDEYRKKLLSLGAKLLRAERKMLRVTGDSHANSIIPKNNYLRVRDEGNLIRVSYKTTADQTGNLSDQKEIDIEVNDFDKSVKIFEVLGIKFNNRQETLREEWSYKNAEITIDTWPGLDPYSEIEAHSEKEVKEIAEELGFDWSKMIITAAPEIYARIYKTSIEDVLEMVSNITFENNPFAGMQKYELEYN